jgi:hypothetical protein
MVAGSCPVLRYTCQSIINPEGFLWEAAESLEHPIMRNFSTKNAGGVTFTEPHGSAIADNDGAPEIITSTKMGTFIFWNNWKNPASPSLAKR